MSDIVDKADAWDAIAEKNAEITTLRARVAELEEALRWFVDEYERVQAMRQAYVHAPDCRCVLCAYDNARAALKKGKKP